MKNIKYYLTGFLGFFIISAFNVSIGILIYSLIKEKQDITISLIILTVIIISTILSLFLDALRKRILNKPLKEILNATKDISKGIFDINLQIQHPYNMYDEYDKIKINLIKMAEELSKDEILKKDFIANVSHEIKTPLMVIQNYAKLLDNNDLNQETKKQYLIILQENCQKLSNLVTNILKLNKLENQTSQIKLEKFNLSELLVSQILFFENLIDEKNIELICDIEEDLIINSEQSYLEIVINNLISNAIKFSNESGIIKISLKKIINKYEIKITDNGCGMTEEIGNRIFEKFYQGDTSHSKKGNGLGLALVKKVIDILGGSIRVESEINKGTTFTIIMKEQADE